MSVFRPTALALAFLAAATPPFSAQTTPGFEVASVRPTDPTAEPFGAYFQVRPGGRIHATGATLRDLVLRAYGLPAFQVIGGEGWMSTTRFDITAQAAGGDASAAQINAMLRTLLLERFSLSVHRETRDMPAYELTVAGRDARLGPNLRRSSVDCRAVLEGRQVLDQSPVAADQTACQPGSRFVTGAAGATIAITRKGISMTQLAALLTPFASRAVIDRTALSDTYDIELTFSPESTLYVVEGGPPQIAQQKDGMSLSTAVREQLGLRLDSTRAKVDVLVIDGGARPTAD